MAGVLELGINTCTKNHGQQFFRAYQEEQQGVGKFYRIAPSPLSRKFPLVVDLVGAGGLVVLFTAIVTLNPASVAVSADSAVMGAFSAA